MADGTPGGVDVPGIEPDGTRFRVRSGMTGRGTIAGPDGREVVGFDGGLVRMGKEGALGEGLPLTGPDGETVCRVRLKTPVLTKRRYRILDGEGTVVAYYDCGGTLEHRLVLGAPRADEPLGTARNRSTARAIACGSVLRGFLPPSYDVTTPDDRQVGTVEVHSERGRIRGADVELAADAPNRTLWLLAPLVALRDIL